MKKLLPSAFWRVSLPFWFFFLIFSSPGFDKHWWNQNTTGIYDSQLWELYTPGTYSSKAPYLWFQTTATQLLYQPGLCRISPKLYLPRFNTVKIAYCWGLTCPWTASQWYKLLILSGYQKKETKTVSIFSTFEITCWGRHSSSPFFFNVHIYIYVCIDIHKNPKLTQIILKGRHILAQ